MIIETFVTNALREKAYLIYDESSKNAVIVDPGNGDDFIRDFIKEKELNLKYILLTHGHFDHIMGVDFLKEFNAKIVASTDEVELLTNPDINGSALHRLNLTVNADVLVNDSDVLTDTGFDIKVFTTPGHTLGGVCYYIESEKALFTGDTLFRETIGRTDLYKSDFNSLINSIKEKLFILDKDTVCYPGHGEVTNIEHEMRYNPFFN